jgi:hypothetical protein
MSRGREETLRLATFRKPQLSQRNELGRVSGKAALKNLHSTHCAVAHAPRPRNPNIISQPKTSWPQSCAHNNRSPCLHE